MFWLPVFAFFAGFGDAKNLGPRRLPPLPSPALAGNGVDPTALVPKDHVFYSNYVKEMFTVSVEEKLATFGLHLPHEEKPEPKPRRNLWAVPVKSTKTVSFSSMKPTRVKNRGIPMSIPSKFAEVQVGPDNCLECAGLGSNNPAQIGTFTTTYFISNMLATKDQLLNTCVFYTAVFWTADYLTWNRYFPFNQFDLSLKAALSHHATDYACNNNLYSIWMLWPGKAPGGENPGGVTDPTKGNFWEVYVPGSWLYPISQNNEQGTYFQTMSTSMALQCGGTIRVMSIAPTDMNKYSGTIWINQELRTLRDRLQTDNSRYKPTNLIAIDALTESQYLMNWDDLSVKQNLKRGDDLWIDPEELLGLDRRSTCDSNIAYEDSTRSWENGDWFG